MRHAFFKKNYYALSFEQKIIFFAHSLTVILCFFPWFSASPTYDDPFFYNIFQGTGFLIGYTIFLLSLGVTLFFLNKLSEYKKLKLTFSEPPLYFAIGVEQLIFLTFMFSILYSTTKEYEVAEIRFGFFVTFVSQMVGLTSAFLNIKNEMQKEITATCPALKIQNQESRPLQNDD